MWSRETRKRDFCGNHNVPKEPGVPFEFTVKRATVASLPIVWERGGKRTQGIKKIRKRRKKSGGWKMMESHDEGHPPWLEARSIRSRAICLASCLSTLNALLSAGHW